MMKGKKLEQKTKLAELFRKHMIRENIETGIKSYTLEKARELHKAINASLFVVK